MFFFGSCGENIVVISLTWQFLKIWNCFGQSNRFSYPVYLHFSKYNIQHHRAISVFLVNMHVAAVHCHFMTIVFLWLLLSNNCMFISQWHIIALGGSLSPAGHVVLSIVPPVLIRHLCYCYCSCMEHTHVATTYHILPNDFLNAHRIIIHALNYLRREWYNRTEVLCCVIFLCS